MKPAVVLSLVSLSFALAGCAGSGSALARKDSMDARIDQEKIVAVNQWARDRGATMIWVTLPVKPKEALAAEANAQ